MKLQAFVFRDHFAGRLVVVTGPPGGAKAARELLVRDRVANGYERSALSGQIEFITVADLDKPAIIVDSEVGL